MDYDLTEEERGKLSIFLNEEYFPNPARTFITAQDMMDLNDKLIEKEKWYTFFDFARDEFMDSAMGYADYFSFLINPPRFCWLVKEFLKSELTSSKGRCACHSSTDSNFDL